MNHRKIVIPLFTPLFIFCLGAQSFLSSESVYAAGAPGENCEGAFETAANPATSSDDQQAKEAAAVKAGEKFFKYFEVMRWNLKERAYLLDLIEQALIAKEGVLIMGPPGTAKSQVADTVLGGIIDEDKVKEIAMAKDSKNKTNKGNRKNRKALADLEDEPTHSFFRLQLTAETTMSETHGPLNFKKLTEENIYDRKYEDSMLNFKNVFIDEIFDARPNALRNILGILGERAHSQGGRTRKAKLETFIAATNSYLSQVYEKAGNDGPKAVIDRFSFSTFVPGELEKTQSAVDIIRGAKKESAQKPIPKLTFQELDQIRDLVPDVDIPVHVASFLAVLSKQLKEETETLETASLKTYNEALRNGDAAAPPYRATKYHSPRSLGKAAGILKAWVVRDWLKQQLDPKIPPQDKRELKATLQDVKALEQFFTLNGPSDDYVKKLINRANDHERAQLEAILQERKIFRDHYADLIQPIHNRYNAQVGKYTHEVVEAANLAAKKAAALKLALQWVNEVEPHLPKTDELSELDGNAIGALMLDEVLNQSGISLIGDSDWKVLIESEIKLRPQVIESATQPEPRSWNEVETENGAKYHFHPHHPALGEAWEDPRGLTWSDLLVKDGNGKNKDLLWEAANEYCLKLNTDETKRESVKKKLAEREALLTPLRKKAYNPRNSAISAQSRDYLLKVSKEFGPIPGCYLPSREEFLEQVTDMEDSVGNYQFQLFTDSKGFLRSSSRDPHNKNMSFAIYSDEGTIDIIFDDGGGEVRCVCFGTP